MMIGCISFVNAQITNEPLRTKKSQLKTIVPVIEMPAFDLKKLQEEDRINDGKIKPYRFGKEFEVNLRPESSGVWEELPNGDRIWRITISSKNAKTLNFIFNVYELAPGATIHLYNDDRSFVLGAYTDKMNNKNKSLGTWIADGEKITIELYEPAAVNGMSKLQIGSVVHGYRTVANYEAHTKRLNQSGPCNQDVNCDIGSDFNARKDELKKGVALILNNGNDWCTGTLINNTSNNGAPYLLTANHCAGGEANWTFRFNWISTNTVCAENTDSIDNGPSNYYQTTSGATVLARNDETDFELVEITGGLDNAWDLEWAGWDRSGNVPSYTVGIHHPSGDIMKVCRDNNVPEYFARPFNGNPQTKLWRIIGGGFNSGWDIGVTEPGSSGSALFDPNGRIIGQLAGGFAECFGTNDDGTEDWYGRFDVSWDFGSTNSTRLSNWLDPENRGCVVLNTLSEEMAGMNVCEGEVVGGGGGEKQPVVLFPNPVEEILFVMNLENEATTYFVFNVYGRKILEGNLNGAQLDVSSLSTGVYFVQIENQTLGEDFVKKIVVE